MRLLLILTRRTPPDILGLLPFFFAALAVIVCLSGCGGCYERTPDGLGIAACRGKSW